MTVAAYQNQLPSAAVDMAPSHVPEAFEKEVAQTLAADMALLLAGAKDLPCHALIELGQCEDVDRHAILACVKAHGLSVERLFDGTPEAELADQGPWLVSLPVQPPGALLEALALHAGVRQALSIVASPLALPDLARHMRGWLEGRIPPDPSIEGDEPCDAVLRWFDPRIGLDMPACWPETDRQQFMRAFRWWAAWRADFSPRLLRGPSINAPAPRAEPLPLDQPLLLALDQLNTPESMLAAVRENDVEPGELDHIARPLQRWLAHRLRDDAQRLALGEWVDQYMLLAMGLRLHPDVANVPALQPMLAAAAANERSLTDTVSDIAPALMQQLAQEAPQALAAHAQALLDSLRRRRLAAPAAHPFHISHTEVR